MMCLFKFSAAPISFEESCIHTLVMENKRLFRHVLTSFEFSSCEDFFVFSENFEPFDFEKKGCFIGNVLNVDVNNKKLSAKINGYLESLINAELPEKTGNVKTALYNLGEALSDYTDYDFCFRQDFDALTIVKLLDFKLCRDEYTEQEVFIKYVNMLLKYLGTKVFVTVNLFLYFDEDELRNIFETLAINNIYVLNLEGFNPECLKDLCCFHIIDSDLCSIDSEDNC